MHSRISDKWLSTNKIISYNREFLGKKESAISIPDVY